jgi:hypothetical protein
VQNDEFLSNLFFLDEILKGKHLSSTSMEKYGIMELISFHVHLHFKGPHTDSKSVNWGNILDEILNVKLNRIVKGVFDGFRLD